MKTQYPIPKKFDRYHWNLEVDFDELSRNVSLEYGFEVLDMSPLYLRPDSHPGGTDCLHFCIPGPLNLFSILLLQMLYNKEI